MTTQMTKSNCWNILIVDDEQDMHLITENAFYEEKLQGKELNFISAITEQAAKDLLETYQQEISVVILDMVISHNGDEGMNVLEFLINELRNKRTQVILRTGYPGRASVNVIKEKYPEVIILEKGGTDADTLIKLVSEAIVRYQQIDLY